MRKRKHYILVLMILLFTSGCSNNIKSGTYYAVNDEWGKIKLSLTEDDKVTLDFITVNSALEAEKDNAPLLFGNSYKSTLEESKVRLTGIVNKDSKQFKFTNPNEIVGEYTVENGVISLIDKDDKDFSFTFFPEGSKKIDSLIEQFNSSTNGTPLYVQGVIENDISDEDYNENYEESVVSSEEESPKFSQKEISKVAKEIKDDFSKSLEGHWVGSPLISSSKTESTFDMSQDKTFTAIYKDGDSSYSNGQTDVSYNGEYTFIDSNELEKNITALIDDGVILDLKDINTYSKYSAIAGEYMSSFELKVILTVSGVIHKDGKPDEEYSKNGTKEKIVDLKIWDGRVKYQSMLDLDKISYYAK